MKSPIIVLILVSLVLTRVAHATILYVAPNGDDSWSGRLTEPNAEGTDGPLATLIAARDAIRKLKEGEELKEPVEVLIRGGVYWMNLLYVRVFQHAHERLYIPLEIKQSLPKHARRLLRTAISPVVEPEPMVT